MKQLLMAFSTCFLLVSCASTNTTSPIPSLNGKPRVAVNRDIPTEPPYIQDTSNASKDIQEGQKLP